MTKILFGPVPLLVGFLLCLMPDLAFGCGRGSIVIENNQYKNILIAIAQDVPENTAIIDKLKEVFTDASELVYKLTHQRAYFGDITILVPQTWSDSKDYLPVGKQSYDKSDVQVELEDLQFGHGNRPFVLHPTGCGETGHYMHITPEFLLNEEQSIQQYGLMGRVISHEWAHLRWGVYDEYPVEGMDDAAMFYADDNGDVQATRCSLALTGQQYNVKTGKYACKMVNGLPEPDCRFIDDELPEAKYASFMYRQFLPHIMEFCDSKASEDYLKHNSKAPNKQNAECGGQSVWDVLNKHPDFVDGANPPVTVTSTAPIITVVRQKVKRTILVLDVSGSMGPNYGNRIGKLQQGCSTYINSNVQDDEYMGMVTFNGTAYPLMDLTLVNATTRSELTNAIPTFTMGATSIGGAIRVALSILENSQDGPGGATIIVVTDGQENRPPWIADVHDDVLRYGITLHSIAITDQADTKVDALALETGGQSFLYSTADQSNALNEAFITISQIGLAAQRQQIPLFSSAMVVSSGDSVQGEIDVDDTTGKNTQFVFDYDGHNVDVSVISPSGIIYNTSYENCTQDFVFGVIRFMFPGEGEQGTWKYNLTNTESVNQKISISAWSQAIDPVNNAPITTVFKWAKRDLNLDFTQRITKQAMYASVTKGYTPVLNADVKALVDRPGTELQQTVVLRDNGAGADAVKDDGIYSAFFLSFTKPGRYNVKAVVKSTPSTKLSQARLVGIGAPVWSTREKRSVPDQPVTNVIRTVPAGCFTLNNIIYPSGRNYIDQPLAGIKLYPPERIKDLVMVGANQETREITLTWTAVGDQLDEGQATSYELRYSSNFDDMQNNFTDQPLVTKDMVVLGGNLSAPKTAGSKELFIIKAPNEGDLVFVFAVRAVDEYQRYAAGDMSNLVSATFKRFHDPELDEMTHIFSVLFGIVGAIGLITIAAVAYQMFSPSSKKNAIVDEEKMESKGVDNVAFSELENKYGAVNVDQ